MRTMSVGSVIPSSASNRFSSSVSTRVAAFRSEVLSGPTGSEEYHSYISMITFEIYVKVLTNVNLHISR